MVLDKHISSFITYKIIPGIYTFNDFSEALFESLQLEFPESSSKTVIEIDDITKKTKLVVKSGIIAIRFDGKSFFNTFLGFTPGWDYKHYNGYFSQKFVKLNTTNKIQLKTGCIDGSIISDLRQLVLYSFVLDKLPGYKVFY